MTAAAAAVTIENVTKTFSTGGTTALWATNIVAAALGIFFFGAVVLVERLVVRAAPEHVA